MTEVKSEINFSIIVVCLNPGEKLNMTIDSILGQTYDNYEIIVKDGGSSDGSIQELREDSRIKVYNEKDTGIYEAMNQAVLHAGGRYIIFMNCGDCFYDSTVLERAWDKMRTNTEPGVFYGDTYSEKNNVLISAPPTIDGFTCYRNIPCHQSCFYSSALCRDKPYDPAYKIRADYDHFLWCFYMAKAPMVNLRMTIAKYEGGGYSESRANIKRDKQEHREITKKYMGKGELFKYRAIMVCTLSAMRRKMAESRIFSGFYNSLKSRIYRK